MNPVERSHGPARARAPYGEQDSVRVVMISGGEIRWVAPRTAPRGGRSGPPESRPQREARRSGEWVTEPAARGGRGDRTRRDLTELLERR
jgi:hypothetical protein